MKLDDWQFICPETGVTLERVAEDTFQSADGTIAYRRVAGVWQFLPAVREQVLAQFMAEYETVRSAEKRGSLTPAYYAALPYRDLTGQFSADWQIRARSFDCLLQKVLPNTVEGLKIVDLGAGNGWLAGRLAAMGANVIAVDLMLNQHDGLGAYRHYQAPFIPIQAEFLGLPFAKSSADFIIFNASLHYVADFAHLFTDLLPILRPNGSIVIVDTPFYQLQISGEQMVAEREAAFRQEFGFASNAQQSENFLTWDRLKQLSQQHRFTYKTLWPKHPLHLRLRPLKAKLRGRREPARFPLIVIQA